MDWQQVIVTVLTSSAVAGAVVVAGSFLAKSIIDRWITMSLKDYEASLQRSLENYRADLQRAAFEHQARFTKLHEKRAEVMEEFYKRLVQAERTYGSLVMAVGSRSRQISADDAKEVHRLSSALFEFFDEHRIYFEPSICDKIRGIDQELNMVWFHSMLAQVEGRVTESETTESKRREDWMKALESMRNEIPKLREDIENDFRKLLGSVPAA